MKKLLKQTIHYFVVLSFMLVSLKAKAEEIPFEKGTLADAYKQARVMKKMLFVDAYTTWCGPCKWMAKNVFTNDDVIKFYSENFVCVKLDMEKGEGKQFAEKYDVHSYPTFIFLDLEGQKIHQFCGKMEAADFVLNGKVAINPEKNLIGFQNKYNKGIRDFNFMREYLNLLYNANMDAKDLVTEMLNSPTANQLVNASDFEMLSNFSELGNRAYSFILENQDSYNSILPPNKYFEYISQIFTDEARKAASKNEPELLANAKNELEKISLEKSKEIKYHMDWVYAQVAKKDIIERAKGYINNFKLDDSQELNNAAWFVFENCGKPEEIKVAENWAALSVSIKKEYSNTDTYANILFKAGKLLDAQKVATESIEIAKSEGLDASDTNVLLKKIEAAIAKK